MCRDLVALGPHLLLVTKPEGSMRTCIDYRPLSRSTRPLSQELSLSFIKEVQMAEASADAPLTSRSELDNAVNDTVGRAFTLI